MKSACVDVVRATMHHNARLLLWDFNSATGEALYQLLLSLPSLLYTRSLRYRSRLAIVSGLDFTSIHDEPFPLSTQRDRGFFVRMFRSLHDGRIWIQGS